LSELAWLDTRAGSQRTGSLPAPLHAGRLTSLNC